MVTATKVATNWAPLVGRWQIDTDRVQYLGPHQTDGSSPHGIVLSEGRLSEGIVRVKVALSQGADAGRVLLGYRSRSDRYVTVGLGGYGNAYVVSEFVPDIGWGRMDGAGLQEQLKPDYEYSLEIEVRGQRLYLTIDGIRVLDHLMSEPLRGNQVGLFAFGAKPVRFKELEIAEEQPKAFVAMPFSEPFTHIYEDVIKPVAQEAGFRAYAVSEVYRPGAILEDIMQGIAESQVVIVEITADNPNVYYELGYAHGLKKPTILLADRQKRLPFDVSGYRVIFYDNTIHGKNDVQDQLRRHFVALKK